MDKKSWIHDNQDKIVVITTIIFLLLLVIAIVASEAHINKNLVKIAEEDFESENSETMIIEDDETIKVIIFESTTEEVTEKSTTDLSSSITSSKDDLLFTNPTTSLTKETSSSSNSSFSSASAIAFYYNDNEPVYVTAEEYYIICGVVMNETGYGSYEGCVAVAQSIRNQIIREKHKGNPYDIASIRRTYQEHYTKTPNDLVRKAVTDVFYNHIVVTKEPIIAWCNGTSSWHSQQRYICSYDGNNFYALANKDW